MKVFLTGVLVTIVTLFSCAQKQNAKKTISKDMTTTTNTVNTATDTATFGTGCFWCTEAIFQQLEGVIKSTSGYSGGHVANPTYKEVCTGNTGHAECIQVVYDPKKITYDELLEVFWQTHDPTTLNRQGADEGTQYRSVIRNNTSFVLSAMHSEFPTVARLKAVVPRCSCSSAPRMYCI